MAPYVAPNRQRFVVPKKILDSAQQAEPLPLSIFPFERLPWDVLIYLLREHVPFPDLVCLALSCKRWLYLLMHIDGDINPILHYPSAKVNPLRSPFAPKPKHDPSPTIVPILRRLQQHRLLPPQNIPCHNCCSLRRLGTEEYWWDRCEEIYCEKTWRRRRNERKWTDRRLVDFEFAEFQSVFKWVWTNWRKHKPGQGTFYMFTETSNGDYEIEANSRDDRHQGQDSRSRSVDTNRLSAAVERERMRIDQLPKSICPECWANIEAKNIALRPALDY